MTVTYNVGSDSLHNGKLYKQIYTSHNGPLNPYYLIREDTMTGKVWMVFLRFSPPTEYLMMDFSLQVGDTFRLYFPGYGLDTVASVWVDVQNRRHIRFKYSSPYYGSKEIIEGVGYSFGFWSTVYPSGDQYMEKSTLCQWKDGVKTYSNTDYNGQCFYENILSTPNIKTENTAEGSIIYPNPATNKIYLSNSSGSNSKINQYKIYNALGKLMLQGVVTNDPVDISMLPLGVYSISLFSDNTLKSTRFTKTN